LKLVDLHIHTNHSDGLFSVEDILSRVRELGLKGFSITDHDTFNGIEPALQIMKQTGMEQLFVAGCEFSSYYENIGELHVLAYFTDFRFRGMYPVLKEYQQSRIRRAHKILECLQAQGIHIPPGEIIKDETTPVGRMHIARKIVNMGYYETTEMVFANLLKSGAPCYIPRREIKTLDVIKAIRDNGGKAVLAHPTCLYNVKNWEHMEDIIRAGLDGLEYKHPKISIELANKIEETWGKKLILTGGSDFHGDSKKEEIGKYGIELEQALNYFPKFTDN
jgi:3',5'-nucleoside bisphosphate phosphatase